MVKNRFLNITPTIIVLYSIFGLLPKLDILNQYSAPFPISCFDLYSTVSNRALEYDLVFNLGLENESYLYFNNKSHNQIETKFYRSWIRKIGKNFENTCEINNHEIIKILDNNLFEEVKSIHLAKITSRYSKIIHLNDYELSLLFKIK